MSNRSAGRSVLLLLPCLAFSLAGEAEEVSYRLPVAFRQGPYPIEDFAVTLPFRLTESYRAVTKEKAPVGSFHVELREKTGKKLQAQYLPAVEGICDESVSFYIPSGDKARDLWLYFKPVDAAEAGLEDEIAGTTKKEMLSDVTMGPNRVTLTEGWNNQAGSRVRGPDGGAGLSIYRVTPFGKKQISPHFVFEKISEGPVVTAFIMKAKSDYGDTFVWYIYRKGGYRIRRVGGHDATSMYWMAHVSGERYYLMSHDRFPREIVTKGYRRGSGRFCLASVGEKANFLFCADRTLHCVFPSRRVYVHGAWREMFVRFRSNSFDDMAADGDAITDWMDHVSERFSFGKPEKVKD
jgi:hypothetical protein